MQVSSLPSPSVTPPQVVDKYMYTIASRIPAAWPEGEARVAMETLVEEAKDFMSSQKWCVRGERVACGTNSASGVSKVLHGEHGVVEGVVGARADGVVDIWDYFYRQNEVAYSHKIGDSMLSSIAVQGSVQGHGGGRDAAGELRPDRPDPRGRAASRRAALSSPPPPRACPPPLRARRSTRPCPEAPSSPSS